MAASTIAPVIASSSFMAAAAASSVSPLEIPRRIKRTEKVKPGADDGCWKHSDWKHSASWNHQARRSRAHDKIRLPDTKLE